MHRTLKKRSARRRVQRDSAREGSWAPLHAGDRPEVQEAVLAAHSSVHLGALRGGKGGAGRRASGRERTLADQALQLPGAGLFSVCIRLALDYC